MYSDGCIERLWAVASGVTALAAAACGPAQNTGSVPQAEQLERTAAPIVRQVVPWDAALASLKEAGLGTDERVAAIGTLEDSVVEALREVQEPLVGALSGREATVALAAERAIRRMRDDVAAVLIAASREPAQRRKALGLLNEMTVPEEWLGRVADGMVSEDYRVRLWAVAVATEVAERNAGGLGVLRTGIQDREAVVQLEALEAVARIGPEAAMLVGEVALALDDEDIAVREAACFALAALGAAAKVAVPELERTVRESTGRLAGAARGALEVISGE